MPWPMRPVVLLYGGAVGALLWATAMLLRATVRTRVAGRERLPRGADGTRANAIYCCWHDAVPLVLVSGWPSLKRRLSPGPLCWLQHPLAHMKPIHVLLRMLGVEHIVLGSTGFGGRSGADAMVELLRRGCSAVVQPDGPHGPARGLKAGVLHLSAQSGVSVVPLRLEVTRALRFPTWDRTRFPVPFSTITLTIGYPVRVAADRIPQARETIVAALG